MALSSRVPETNNGFGLNRCNQISASITEIKKKFSIFGTFIFVNNSKVIEDCLNLTEEIKRTIFLQVMMPRRFFYVKY